ncbi:hypothetical protein CJD44_32720 [Streptomyces sp. alain-838]|nr:hypothetical protein [Streptomyces sp. alain-838]PAK22851.1 hypothetical protein CJD44_32720 [Streptomyces sp. alain-838]
MDVVDRRTRTCRPLGTSGMALLSIRCEILDQHGRRPLVPAHTYSKLVVPDPLLKKQFAEAALELTNSVPSPSGRTTTVTASTAWVISA